MAKLSVDGLVCGWKNTVLPNFDVNKVAEKTKAESGTCAVPINDEEKTVSS